MQRNCHFNAYFWCKIYRFTTYFGVMAKNDQKNFGQKISFFCYRDLALAVSVVLPSWDPFFDFSFPSYGFREGTPHFVILRRLGTRFLDQIET